MITRLTARNHGCIKDVSLALTPLHALIGPNDSGKAGVARQTEEAVGRQARHREPAADV